MADTEKLREFLLGAAFRSFKKAMESRKHEVSPFVSRIAKNIIDQLFISILRRSFLYSFRMNEKLLCPFGEVLVRARKARKVTQYRLAKLTKRSARYISMLEHNTREPQLSTVLMIARALNMDAGELVRAVDALMPQDWALPAEEDKQPKKAGRPKKKAPQKQEN